MTKKRKHENIPGLEWSQKFNSEGVLERADGLWIEHITLHTTAGEIPGFRVSLPTEKQFPIIVCPCCGDPIRTVGHAKVVGDLLYPFPVRRSS